MSHKKMLLSLGLLCAIILSAFSLPVIADAKNSRQITVSEDGRVIATVAVEQSRGDILDITVRRAGAPVHTYRYFRNFPSLSASVGKRTVFTYFPHQTGDRVSDDGDARELLAADMRILRVVRKTTAIVALAEIAYLAVTGDDSAIFQTPQPSLRANVVVTEPVAFSLSDCNDACMAVLKMCKEDPNVKDKNVCYTGAFDCVGKCGNAPAPEKPPES